MNTLVIRRWASYGFVILLLAGFGSSCAGDQPVPPNPAEFKPDVRPLPPGLATYEAMAIPADNPMTPEKVALGWQLFFDTRLSADGSRSCYSCHLNEHGLTDGLPLAIGALEKKLPRHSPTLWNIGYHKEFYWDGRSGSLEKQGMAAWTGGNMGANKDEITAKINAIPGYRAQFQTVFGGEATPERIMMAVSAYERTIIGGQSAYDRWKAGDESAVSGSVKRGYQVFKDSKCDQCHAGVLFTDLQYHNVGIGMDKPEPDVGRAKVTNKPEETGAFKTPTLRDVARSAPYFHDGSGATLQEVVDLMVGGGKPNQWLDKKNLQKVNLKPEQKQELLEFLRSLTIETSLGEPALPQ
ncbi:MAG: cytochrome-c peroxidase [Acidobacteria bacterium]|nr:cytochrome-c peroxidase [Acidobacteriota bacterium]